MRRLMVTFVLLTALACGGTPTEPSGEQHGPRAAAAKPNPKPASPGRSTA